MPLLAVQPHECLLGTEMALAARHNTPIGALIVSRRGRALRSIVIQRPETLMGNFLRKGLLGTGTRPGNNTGSPGRISDMCNMTPCA